MSTSLDPAMRAIAKSFGSTVRAAALHLEGVDEPLTRRATLRRSADSIRVLWGDEWIHFEGKASLPGAISIGKPFSVILQPAGTFEGLPVFGWDRMYKPEHSGVLRYPEAAATLKGLLLASRQSTLVLTRDAVHLTTLAPSDAESVSVVVDRFFDTLLALKSYA